MHIFATFEHSIYLEKAITAVQMQGVAKEAILAVPLDKKGEERKLFDTMHRSDGLSLMDLAAILGTIFMLLGTIYGFELAWGPIFWGLMGLIAGAALGLAIKLMMLRRFANRQDSRKAPEVVVVIDCPQDKLEMVKETLWAHYALGVGRLSLSDGR